MAFAPTPPEQHAATRREDASFRDPDSQVFYANGRVLRAVSERGLESWNALKDSGLLRDWTGDGRLVRTSLMEERASPATTPLGERCAGVLEHERVPVISYPYEWTFGMLRGAALLQLDLILAALEENLVLKDATPYNVQWRGTRPLFIDLGSFERYRAGEPWIGYRQFCMLFLNPLLLEAYRGVSFRPWLRGSSEGIAPEDCARLLTGAARLRPGVLTHVYLHSRLGRRHAASRRDARADLREAGFNRELIRSNVTRLRRLVAGLRRPLQSSAWTGYGEDNSYAVDDAAQKAAFVTQALGTKEYDVVWDLGCNDGTFSRLAAERARTVVAADADAEVVERLYEALAAEGNDRILPLVLDVADLSPAQGWLGRERSRLEERSRPQLTLCLALVHHLAITRNIPLPDLFGWLRSLGTRLVVELVDERDPMTERLLAASPGMREAGYGRASFERALDEAFQVERRHTLSSGTRHLYEARPR